MHENHFALNTLTFDHVIGLDGQDQGPAAIAIAPSGEISTIRPAQQPAVQTGTTLTAVPLLADSHVHLGISDGVTEDTAFHSLDHVDAQLRHLALRGVGHVHSLGTDQRWLQQRLRRRVASGDSCERAFGYSAGIGFGALNGWPPELTTPEQRFRPQDPDSARRQVRELANWGCRTLKIWVDDFGGKVPKIGFSVVQAVINEAQQCGITTFAHVHFNDDAVALVSSGISVLAHSVRDKVMDDALLARTAERGVTLVPTLSREEAEIAFSVVDNPYLTNQFFLASEHDLVSRLRGKTFSDDPETPKRRLEVALKNVARAYAAGVPIALGTDSGFKMKLQGFAQHRELQLLNQAGVRTKDCLKAALQINQGLFATVMTAIVPGVLASFFIVKGNPLENISATELIQDVWVCGKRLPDTDLSLRAEAARD